MGNISIKMAPALGTEELAVTYAALILHDDGIDITAEKLSTLVKAANVDVAKYWPILFAKVLKDKNVGDLITSVGSASAAVAAPAAAAVEEAPAPAAEESEEDMGMGLFGDDE